MCPSEEVGGSLFSDLAQSEDPAHGYTPFGEDPAHSYTPYGKDPAHGYTPFGEDPAHGYTPYREGEDDSSTSSDEEEEEETVGREGRGDILHSQLLDPEDLPTGDLLKLGDSIEEEVQSRVEAPTTSSSSVSIGTADVVSNSGFLEDGDMLGLGIGSYRTSRGDPFDPFADSSAQQLPGGSAFSVLSPTPMQPASALPTQPQRTADTDFMAFANPAAFSDLGAQFHSQSSAGPSVQTQSVTQPRADPFAGLTTLGTQLPPSTRPKPHPPDASKMKANPLLPQGQRKPAVGVGSRNHGNYSSVIGRRDERGTRFSGGKMHTSVHLDCL